MADDAKSIGLVDELGDLNDAIDYAARLVNLNPQEARVRHLAPGGGSGFGSFESLFFGMAKAYLPEELTYALLQMKSQAHLLQTPNKASIQALAPINEPKL